MFRTIARPPDRAARIHNTFSASNMILNTPQGTQEVNKMVSEDFWNKLGPETNNFWIFYFRVYSEFSFLQITRKRKVWELRVVI